jgi:hypothetical protein
MLTALLASRGPFGPTAEMCFLIPLTIAGPFVLLGLAVRSLIGDERTAGWLLALMAVGTTTLAYFFFVPFTFPDGGGTPMWIWWGSGALAVVLLPAVALREVFKWRRRD